MRYDERVIDQVRERADIVEVISGYIPLKRSGRSFKALCPFHQEKTASFIVNAERQIFHCFGCGVGGDVLAFLMKFENLTFPEALAQMAERVHIKLPERFVAQGEGSIAGKLYEINEAAFGYYRRNLEDAATGRPARDYLERRGFRVAELAEFGIGYATAAWRGLCDHLLARGFREDLILKAGLVVRSSKGTLYDLLRDRVLFPIRNAQGKVVAFGGRVMGDDTPKYLNSPETDIFKKRREFYGLHLAKRHVNEQESRMFIVEGYLDQLRLYGAGFRNTVATLGTALTEEHVHILRNYVTEAVLVYDGDRAGEAAALRALEIFLTEGMVVKLIALPSGVDPDQLIRDGGAEAFERLTQKAADALEFKLQRLLERYDKNDAKGLLRIVSELGETLARVGNAVLADRYVHRLSALLGVGPDAIRSELAKRQVRSERHQPAGKVSGAELDRHEYALLSLMAEDSEVCDRALREITPEDFQGEERRLLFESLARLAGEGKRVTAASLLGRIQSEEARSLVSAAAFHELAPDARMKAFEDLRREMKRRRIRRDLDILQGEIRRAELEGDQEKVLACMRDYQTLLVRMKDQGPGSEAGVKARVSWS